MSKAFTKEDDSGVDVDDVPLPPRPAEPVPITRVGCARLEAELAALRARGDSGARRARVLVSILESVRVLDPQTSGALAGFGCVFVVDKGAGRARYVVVGPDEADAKAGLVSLAAPVGRALLGKRAGDDVAVARPAGEEEWTVVSVAPWAGEPA